VAERVWGGKVSKVLETRRTVSARVNSISAVTVTAMLYCVGMKKPLWSGAIVKLLSSSFLSSSTLPCTHLL
jgi:hypothetical protein